jgi:hypothetical protein
MKQIIQTGFICLMLINVFSCEEREIELVLNDVMEYPFDISGSGEFDEFYYVSESELYEMTEDLDDEVRNNIMNLDIEIVDVQLLANQANNAQSATVTVYFKWDNLEWDDEDAQIDSLFSQHTETVTNDEEAFTMLVDELDAVTIGQLRVRLDAAARHTDVSAFEVRARGMVNGGEMDAVLTVRVKISLVTKETL